MKISNGTKQGAILLPILQATIEEIEMKALGLIVRVYCLFVNAVLFADDLLLNAPSRNSMQQMLEEL